MTKTSHEDGEETITACESVALLSEPDLGGDSIHTFFFLFFFFFNFILKTFATKDKLTGDKQ